MILVTSKEWSLKKDTCTVRFEHVWAKGSIVLTKDGKISVYPSVSNPAIFCELEQFVNRQREIFDQILHEKKTVSNDLDENLNNIFCTDNCLEEYIVFDDIFCTNEINIFRENLLPQEKKLLEECLDALLK